MLACLCGPRPPGAALHAAVRRGDAARVGLLLAAGEPTDLVDRWGLLPIHHAAAEGKAEIVSLLVQAGASADAPGREAGSWAGARPLHYAAFYGKAEAIQALLSKGAYVNATTDGGATPLYVAAWSGEARALRTLLAAGADVSKATAKGTTALHVAAAAGQVSPLLHIIHAALPRAPSGCVFVGAGAFHDELYRGNSVGCNVDGHSLSLNLLSWEAGYRTHGIYGPHPAGRGRSHSFGGWGGCRGGRQSRQHLAAQRDSWLGGSQGSMLQGLRSCTAGSRRGPCSSE